ncbi:MAG: hypothetical protein MJ126_04135 [Lachnospiraceae bacterium]|nr:hypothetical protein [Lachnospiraceae bacterium]
MIEGGGKFEYWVYNYAYRYSNSKSELSESQAVVKVYSGSELIKIYYVPRNQKGITWNVFEINSEGIKTVNSIKW